MDEHHPELNELLGKLEGNKKKRQWNNAMNGLNKAVKKLESVKQRSPARYETGLAQWKLESRIRVASAELKLKDTEEGREKLETLVAELVDHHIARLKKEREHIRTRLEQTEQKIVDAETSRQQAIEKRLKQALPKVKKEKAK